MAPVVIMLVIIVLSGSSFHTCFEPGYFGTDFSNDGDVRSAGNVRILIAVNGKAVFAPRAAGIGHCATT